jgi:hypothetical protein
MKAKLIVGGIALIAGLYFVNRLLNEEPKYMENTPSTGTPASGAVRQELTIGFLPVT